MDKQQLQGVYESLANRYAKLADGLFGHKGNKMSLPRAFLIIGLFVFMLFLSALSVFLIILSAG